jgi:hypothetical protein
LEMKVHSILVKDYKRTQWENYTIFIIIIFIFIFSYRRSRYSFSTTIKSEIEWNNISRH